VSELLIGAGRRHVKMLIPPDRPEEWTGLVKLDVNPDHAPDVVWDLEKTPWPFKDDTFDEVHAYEVLEHLGRQGDFRSFFAHFEEIWRVLKPGGYLCGTSPSIRSPWLWGDPGHTRAITRESFTFLSQREYRKQVDEAATPMSDYRFCYRGDFEWLPEWLNDRGQTFLYVLRAVKGDRT
jgi:SAM-dependent methyltransferase